MVSKSLQKSSRILIGVGSILDPMDHPKIQLLLVSLLGHLGAKRVPKVLQDSSRGRFSKNLVYTILGRILEGILKIFDLLFSRISTLISHRMFTALFHFAAPILSSWHGGGLSRAAHCVYIYIHIYICKKDIAILELESLVFAQSALMEAAC